MKPPVKPDPLADLALKLVKLFPNWSIIQDYDKREVVIEFSPFKPTTSKYNRVRKHALIVAQTNTGFRVVPLN